MRAQKTALDHIPIEKNPLASKAATTEDFEEDP